MDKRIDQISVGEAQRVEIIKLLYREAEILIFDEPTAVLTPQEADELFARAVKLGGKIAKAPQRVFWGGYSGYIQDLDGYYWEIAFFEGWQFDDNDMLIIK